MCLHELTTANLSKLIKLIYSSPPNNKVITTMVIDDLVVDLISLIWGSLHNMQIYPKMSSIDIFVTLQPVG